MPEIFETNSFDFVICRDVLMFVEKIPELFYYLNKTVLKGLRFMGWFQPTDKRVKNINPPFQMIKYLDTRQWNVSLEHLDWYKRGYMITANKIKE